MPHCTIDTRRGITFFLHMPLCWPASEEPWMLCHKTKSKLPCYADNPLSSRCHAIGSSQTIQEAIACVDCFLGMLTSLLPGLLSRDCHMDTSAEDMRELLARTAWSPAPFPELNASHHQQPCFPTALGRSHQVVVLSYQGTRNFLWGAKLSDWHKVSDAFIVWRGWVTSAAMHRTPSKIPLWPSFPFLLSLSLGRWRCYSDPGLTEPCWLW